jgi:hypothetical protein
MRARKEDQEQALLGHRAFEISQKKRERGRERKGLIASMLLIWFLII